MPKLVHDDIRFALSGAFAPSTAEEKGLAGAGIGWSLGVALREALVFGTLGFFEQRWEGGKTSDDDGCL